MGQGPVLTRALRRVYVRGDPRRWKAVSVAPGDVIRVETQEDKDGKVEFGDVLAVSAEAGSVVPAGAGALVTGEVVEQGRGNKILVFHYKRKKQYKKLRGHLAGLYRGPHHRDCFRWAVVQSA